ncbi:type II toxin-antitoxin system VapC family toxin [soil metagenome]
MSLLLDTHVLLWVLAADPTLAASARDAIIDGNNRVFVSAVTAWEIVIKRALGKLRAPDDLHSQLRRLRLNTLAITFQHAEAVADLPGLHADLFDRLLIAQARTEHLTLVTRDAQIARYDVATLTA